MRCSLQPQSRTEVPATQPCGSGRLAFGSERPHTGRLSAEGLRASGLRLERLDYSPALAAWAFRRVPSDAGLATAASGASRNVPRHLVCTKEGLCKHSHDQSSWPLTSELSALTTLTSPRGSVAKVRTPRSTAKDVGSSRRDLVGMRVLCGPSVLESYYNSARRSVLFDQLVSLRDGLQRKPRFNLQAWPLVLQSLVQRASRSSLGRGGKVVAPEEKQANVLEHKRPTM